MDIGAIIKAPMKDKDWLKTCLFIGLFGLIPIAGTLNMLGWMKATYEGAKRGDETLPKAELAYIGAGWAMFVALLPLVVIVIGGTILMAILGILAAKIGVPVVGTILSLLFNLVLLVVMLVLPPALIFRHVSEGTGFGGAFDIGGIKAVITSNGFIMFIVTGFVVGIIGQLGFAACGLGLLLTLPLAQAMNAHAILAFERSRGG